MPDMSSSYDAQIWHHLFDGTEENLFSFRRKIDLIVESLCKARAFCFDLSSHSSLSFLKDRKNAAILRRMVTLLASADQGVVSDHVGHQALC